MHDPGGSIKVEAQYGSGLQVGDGGDREIVDTPTGLDLGVDAPWAPKPDRQQPDDDYEGVRRPAQRPGVPR